MISAAIRFGDCYGKRADSGDSQCLGVTVVGLAAGSGVDQQVAQVVKRFGLGVARPEVAEQLQSLLEVGGGRLVVPGRRVNRAQVLQDVGYGSLGIEVAE